MLKSFVQEYANDITLSDGMLQHVCKNANTTSYDRANFEGEVIGYGFVEPQHYHFCLEVQAANRSIKSKYLSKMRQTDYEYELQYHRGHKSSLHYSAREFKSIAIGLISFLILLIMLFQLINPS